MVTSILFEEPVEVVESAEQAQVSFATRLLYRVAASLVGIIPALAATYSGLQIVRFFRSWRDAGSIGTATRILAQLSVFNTPLIIALGFSAFLAFGLAIALATDSKRKQASVGLPFSIGIALLGVTPAVLLWWTETTTIEVLSGKHMNTPPTVVAQTIRNLLFWALATGIIVPVVIFVCAAISLFIPRRLRMDSLSLPRVFVWGAAGMLLLIFAGAFFALI